MTLAEFLRTQSPMPDDWVGNVMRGMPYNPYTGRAFEDRIFRRPVAPGTQGLGFDVNAYDPRWLGPLPTRTPESF
jgi:hypothetical protein